MLKKKGEIYHVRGSEGSILLNCQFCRFHVIPKAFSGFCPLAAALMHGLGQAELYLPEFPLTVVLDRGGPQESLVWPIEWDAVKKQPFLTGAHVEVLT